MKKINLRRLYMDRCYPIANLEYTAVFPNSVNYLNNDHINCIKIFKSNSSIWSVDHITIQMENKLEHIHNIL